MSKTQPHYEADARWQKKVEKKCLVRRPLKSELLIQRADSLAESTSGEAERGVERKTQQRWRFRWKQDAGLRYAIEKRPRKTGRKRDISRGNCGDRRASKKERRGERDKKRSGRQIGSRWWIKFGQINEAAKGRRKKRRKMKGTGRHAG